MNVIQKKKNYLTKKVGNFLYWGVMKNNFFELFPLKKSKLRLKKKFYFLIENLIFPQFLRNYFSIKLEKYKYHQNLRSLHTFLLELSEKIKKKKINGSFKIYVQDNYGRLFLMISFIKIPKTFCNFKRTFKEFFFPTRTSRFKKIHLAQRIPKFDLEKRTLKPDFQFDLAIKSNDVIKLISFITHVRKKAGFFFLFRLNLFQDHTKKKRFSVIFF